MAPAVGSIVSKMEREGGLGEILRSHELDLRPFPFAPLLPSPAPAAAGAKGWLKAVFNHQVHSHLAGVFTYVSPVYLLLICLIRCHVLVCDDTLSHHPCQN
jgi:hypothetical protein